MLRKNIDCCETMKSFTEKEGFPISYNLRNREFSFPLQGSPGCLRIRFCPFCGTELPASLDNAFYEVLKREYNIDEEEALDRPDKLPREFQSDVWWKSRGL